MERIKVTDEILAKLRSERERTKVSSTTLLASSENLPKGLKDHTLGSVLRQDVKSVRKDYLDFILKAYAAQPDAPPEKHSFYPVREGYMVIPDHIRHELRDLQKETGLGSSALLRGVKNRPAGTSHHQITGWINGNTESAPIDAVNFILDLYRARAQGDIQSDFMLISDDLRAELHDLKHKTGIMPAVLLKGASAPPRGLTAYDIRRWIDPNGARAKREYVEWVLTQWREQTILEPFRAKDHKEVTREMARTDATLAAIMRRSKRPPLGFNKTVVQNIIHYTKKTVKPDHLKHLLEILRSLPDKRQHTPLRPTRKVYKSVHQKGDVTTRIQPLRYIADDLEPLKEKDRKALERERARTGVGATALFRRFAAEKPSKLSPNTISAWITGKAKYASKSRLEWVLAKWKSLPNR